MNLTDYKHKKKVKLLLTKGNEIIVLFKDMQKQLTPYKHFAAVKEVINSLHQNEAFLTLSLKKLEEETNGN